ncbi:FecR family protein [Olleya aquimaris]|uniref:FecR family protein n=1 Tax=Olleya aquimaris TaxID=639310 RepID=A0A327RN70_9FLAO|nr:FecR family protein [Olleya aquimaris]RAJ17054.1 FecR family protein [Olleya aquimaris]
MDKELLIKKWLNNDLTEAEEKAFKQLDDYAFNKEIVETAKLFKASAFTNIDDFETFKAKYKTQNKPVKKLQWLSPMLKIAGVIVIALGVYFTIFSNNNTEIKTLASQKTTIDLPDQSQVVLNALSVINYNKNTWEDNRTLKLDGEAYFKVAKGNTFDVITSQGKVTVVGTQFNVKQRNNFFEVQCFEGVVKVKSDTIIRTLTAGDVYRLLDGKFTQSKTINTIAEWVNNTSVFNAIPIKQVFAELERQYNIKASLINVDGNRLFTGGFTHSNLEDALKSITQPMNLTFQLMSSKQVNINGQNN